MCAARLSVVIPTRGRPAALARCLAALGRTTLPARELEVVVVGDGRDVEPPAPEAAGEVPVRWLSVPHGGPAAARNAGAEVAAAPVLAFTDDDCAPGPAWAARLLAASDAHPDALIGGTLRNALPHDPWASASHHVRDVFLELYNRRHAAPGFVPTSTLALRRDVFAALDGLDERFGTAAGEDREFCHRAAAAGHPVVLEPGAVVEHHHPMDLREFLRQSTAYARGEVTYHRLVAARGGEPDVMGDERFYREIVLRALRQGPRTGVPLALRCAASQVAFRVTFARARRCTV